MADALSSFAKRALAVLVLAIAAYVLFKLVVGVVTAFAWAIAAVVAIVAILWAVRTL